MAAENYPDRVRIVRYEPKYRKAFRDLNYQWLQKYFTVEPYDEIVLNDPDHQIIRRGGTVLVALLGKEPVGVCALIRHTEKKFELAKMGVTEGHHRKGIGRKLVSAAIETARNRGADTLVLATSPVLEPANNLYRAMGFRDAEYSEIGPLPYQRHSVVMAMDLDTLQSD